MIVGQNIRALRKKKGPTQARLGKLCCISDGTIGSYENGITIPKRRVEEKTAQLHTKLAAINHQVQELDSSHRPNPFWSGRRFLF